MRSTWIRQISAIRKDGVESAINLTCGLNCVIGASNTGKTRIAKTVEFVCGGKETPFTDKTAYEVAQVTFIPMTVKFRLVVRLALRTLFTWNPATPQLLPALILFHHVPANQSIRFFLPC